MSALLQWRWIPFFVAYLCGGITCISFGTVYLVLQGCYAARKAGRDRYEGRQISDMMCCPTVYIIAAIGLPLSSFFLIASIFPIPKVIAALDASLGSCCFCCKRETLSPGKSIVYALVPCSIGNAVLGLVDVCSMPWIHAVAAWIFFFSGYVVVGLLLFSRTTTSSSSSSSSDKWLSLYSLQSNPKLRYLKPYLLFMTIASLLIGFGIDAFIGECLAIQVVGLALISVECDIQRGEALLTFEASSASFVVSTSDLGDNQEYELSYLSKMLSRKQSGSAGRGMKESSSSSSRCISHEEVLSSEEERL